MKQHPSSKERGTPVGVRVVETPDVVETIKLFRELTGLPVGELREAIRNHSVIEVGMLFALDHEEFEPQLNQLLQQVDEIGVDYELLVDGETESREYLHNIIEHWHDIGLQIEIMNDLKSGEPNIETLRQMKERWSEDVFRATLEPIAQGDGYQVDEETLNWIRRELRD